MENGYAIVRNCVSKDILTVCENYFRMKFFVLKDFITTTDSHLSEFDPVKPFNHYDYSDTFTEALLVPLMPVISKATGVENLVPTYSFVRFYEKGQYLVPHKDRTSCQYSITLPLVSECNTPWPIFAGGNKIDLNIGDLLVYKGCEIEHWREPYDGIWQVQAHLHYVNADDPGYAHAKFDGRPSLGVKKSSR